MCKIEYLPKCHNPPPRSAQICLSVVFISLFYCMFVAAALVMSVTCGPCHELSSVNVDIHCCNPGKPPLTVDVLPGRDVFACHPI